MTLGDGRRRPVQARRSSTTSWRRGATIEGHEAQMVLRRRGDAGLVRSPERVGASPAGGDWGGRGRVRSGPMRRGPHARASPPRPPAPARNARRRPGDGGLAGQRLGRSSTGAIWARASARASPATTTAELEVGEPGWGAGADPAAVMAASSLASRWARANPARVTA